MKVILVLCSFLMLIACSSQKASNDTQTSTTKVEVSQNNETTKPTAPPKSAAKLASLGEQLKLNDWEIKSESFEFINEIKINDKTVTAKDGEKFLRLNVSLTNNGTESDPFNNGSGIKVIYNEKFEYKSSTSTLDGDLSYKFVKPLSTEKGMYLFQLPEKVANAPEELIAVFEVNKEKVSVKLR
ncbi:DUF4352 domain-containing protein [Paenibacillus alba]|uniref:DUF4352 domain-containing protein n=1 Tax=Paenibacillus alba TaxID=1197127 RepID=A0ABU6GDL0_9BACL|nr:DUF4352 domain-containing protein [Paenibacillus alba]MEC0232262.1 DUF4352 domain-containing protein [Paenibacillus alba]NQX68076.1 DUF4352 domain-containing protein [Paenibacillus alba]